MRFFPRLAPRCIPPLAVALAALVAPVQALAQYSAPDSGSSVIGEKYHVELSGTLWNPDLAGTISSEQFKITGSEINLLTDLGYTKTRFKDFRIVLRPSKRSKFNIQYTPIQYEAQTSFKQVLVFNGIKFPVAVPVESKFTWKVWRLGYEYDFLYKPRGFVGLLLEARMTTAEARLTTRTPIISPAIDEFNKRSAPLPAIGAIGRAYPLPALAVDFSVTGFKLPNVDPKYQAKYFDWDVHGTYNFTNNVGFQMGWRKVTNFMVIEKDSGDLKFQGLWFGAAVRY
ncbi:MAG: hypothetical protein ABI634_13185 [Acidobacteriota bacterium]